MTAWRAWRPWRLWRDLTLEMPVHPWRLTIAVALWMLLLQLVVLTVAVLISQSWLRRIYEIGGGTWAYFQVVFSYRDLEVSLPLAGCCILWPFVAMPTLHLILFQSIRPSYFRRAHLYRVALCSLFLFPFTGCLGELLIGWFYLNEHGYPTQHLTATVFDILYGILIPAVLVVFWGFADARYLRIRHPWYTSILFGTITASPALLIGPVTRIVV
ncbi:MAG: hypothetical protein H6812_03270 [Phycisphaeraceae bacterium]|nr:hypothetical protein [Phycisphaerales bacterium]MCB9842261.1 hypothetical protein [Phycisphaeraceae bacterium]